MNIAFIGYGNMAKAIAQGLLKQSRYKLYASSPSLPERERDNDISTHFDNRVIAAKADVLILAVKPKQMAEVLKNITPVLKTQCLVISVAAGITLDWLGNHCPSGQAIVRSMPNTPAAVSEAATGLIANAFVSHQDKQTTEGIFSSIGIYSWLKDEAMMDTLTALSGSGPAYVFKFMESIVEAAITLGLNPETAKAFTLQTVKGALSLAQQSECSLSQLRKKVTSPKGTTAAALDILCHGELDEIILKAMTAAQQRAKELGSGPV